MATAATRPQRWYGFRDELLGLGALEQEAGRTRAETLTRALAVKLGPQRVNTIRPGYTDSEMWQFLPGGQRDDLRRRVADALPVRRMRRRQRHRQG
jgi:NAD(P)-dependent dehydrogenase (short-subunit alcohol dehydrogenase family)